jgi:hypothetical protein
LSKLTTDFGSFDVITTILLKVLSCPSSLMEPVLFQIVVAVALRGAFGWDADVIDVMG